MTGERITLDDLSVQQLGELQTGDPLTFPPSETCPMEVGEILVVEQASGIAFTAEEIEARPELADSASVTTPVLWITVTEIRLTRKMLWRVLYRTTDHRPLWLRKGPPKGDGSRLRQQRWTPIEEHGLTPNLAQAFDAEAETVPGAYQNVIEMRARLRDAERAEAEQAEELAKKQARSVNEAVRDVLIQRARLGLPPESPAIAALQRAVAEAQSEIEEAA